jgi:hypothetical protein
MKLTPPLLEAFLKCPTKCFLLAHDEIPTGNSFADWVRGQREAYRGAGTGRLKACFAESESVAGSLDLAAHKSGNWRLAVDVPVEVENMRSCLQAVENVPSGSGNPSVLLPIRFVFGNRPTLTDKLLRAFDASVLSGMAGRIITSGRIICGDEHTSQKVKVPVLKGPVRPP